MDVKMPPDEIVRSSRRVEWLRVFDRLLMKEAADLIESLQAQLIQYQRPSETAIAARGEPNCCDVGSCWREANGIPRGQQYEKCVAVHAEQNAIISAARSEMIGATMYIVGFENGKRIPAEPCLICQRMLQNAGIARVVTDDEA